MARKEPRGTRDMNSGRHDRERNHNRESASGGRSGQSRTGSEWRDNDRDRTGGRGMDMRHVSGGRDVEQGSEDMSRYNMGGDRERNRDWSGRGSERGGSRRSGSFPLDNLTYNIVTILHEKSKGLEAFDRYLQDARGDEVADLLEEIREQDERAVEELQEHLHRLLGESGRGRRVA